MSLTICFYEDKQFKQFYPLTHLRPVYLLRPGIMPLYERCKGHFPEASICLSARNRISSLVAQQVRSIPVNIVTKGTGDVLFLNGRIRDYGDLLHSIRGCRLTTVFKNAEQTVGVLFKAEGLKTVSDLTTPDIFKDILPTQKTVSAEYDTTAKLYNHLWELVEDISEAITHDFRQLEQEFEAPNNVTVHEGVHFINDNDIFLGSDVEILPTTVIDATNGPVYIGPNSKIQPQVTIIGPCFIGANSVIFQGKISGSSIGPTSRVGGEVEASVFQSYVNKYHAGFIGHSYVGPWVNFGAMTTNSDLKNNYSNVRVTIEGKEIDTGSIKVGSFIGDYCRFGIGTLLNTGINVGVSCNIFGGTLITDKEVKSFSWGSSKSYEKYEIDKAIETVKTICQRRDCQLSSHESDVLRAVFENDISDEGCLDF